MKLRHSLSFVVLAAGVAVALFWPPAPADPERTPTPAPILATVAGFSPSPVPDPPLETEVPGTKTPPEDPGLTFVVLGQDRTAARCERGERCTIYNPPHSDVFVIVHVQGSKATVVLVPRSLYVPPEMMLHGSGFEWNDPMWSMQVYGKLGAAGVRQYVSVAFDLEVDGVFAIDMDQFASLIDKMGGLEVGWSDGQTDQVAHLDGAGTLAYLRDSENNWGCAVYDCEGRIFKVAKALQARVHDIIFWTLGSYGLFEDDLTFSEILGYVSRYYDFEKAEGTVEFVRLWIPPLVTDDTPLEIRGLVPTRPLYEWMAEVLGP